MRTVVVGAGVSGLVAARGLTGEVVVLDKGRSPGGRLATRRIGDAVVDHGAQFFTVRGAGFRDQVDDWLHRDLARVWCHGFFDREDGYPRYIGTAGMNSLAKDLADGLDVQTGRMVFSLRRGRDHWEIVIDDGEVFEADQVVITCPVAQAWALLAQTDVELPDDLARSEYHRTVALLATLDRPSAIPAPGGVQLDPTDPDVPFGFIGDNQAKGISPVPAVTFHATQPWSRDHWDRPADELRELMERAAAPWIGAARIVEAHVKKWRFAGPVDPWPEPCWRSDDGSVVLAGDMFAGPKVEGAFNSGVAAAAALSAR